MEVWLGEPIKDILSRRIAAKGLSNVVVAARVCAVAKEVSEGLFEPVSYKSGCLKILVSSDSRAHIIRLREDKWRSKINKKLGQEFVQRLSFKIS